MYSRRRLIRLLAVLPLAALAACGSSSLDGGGDSPRTAVPPELVGEWHTGTVSSSGFYDPSSGSFSDAASSGIFYKLNADGTFTYGFLEHSSLYGCSIDFFVYKQGTVTVQGTSFTLHPTSGSMKYLAPCQPSLNEERKLKPAELGPDPYTYQVGVDQYGSLLQLTTGSGASGTLRPVH
jgi:hypothetical protein